MTNESIINFKKLHNGLHGPSMKLKQPGYTNAIEAEDKEKNNNVRIGERLTGVGFIKEPEAAKTIFTDRLAGSVVIEIDQHVFLWVTGKKS